MAARLRTVVPVYSVSCTERSVSRYHRIQADHSKLGDLTRSGLSVSRSGAKDGDGASRVDAWPILVRQGSRLGMCHSRSKISISPWLDGLERSVSRGLSKCVVRIEAFIIDEVDFETGSWFSR